MYCSRPQYEDNQYTARFPLPFVRKHSMGPFSIVIIAHLHSQAFSWHVPLNKPANRLLSADILRMSAPGLGEEQRPLVPYAETITPRGSLS